MTHRFQINLRGIIDLLSNHLYARPEVFVRELLQNAVDANTARRRLDPDHAGEITLSVTSFRGASPTLEVADNGVGLTEAEIHSFLATIGETSKRDLSGRRDEDFLGQFGIGLLSCFVVSDEIVVVTRSARENGPAVEWRGRADGSYSVRLLDADLAPGTSVYLTCRKGHERLFEAEKIKSLAHHYGMLLPVPIRVESGGGGAVVNESEAPWRQRFADEKDQTEALLDFGRRIFDVAFMDAIPLNSSTGKVDGVAFVLPYATNLNARGAHRVYLRNMLLSEEADNLLPDWAFFVKAVVNADELRPTASRESFYEDERLVKTREELGRCLRDHLVRSAERESSRFARFLSVHHLALKALATQDDECFRLFVDWLPLETTRGRLSIKALRERSETIRYVDDVSQFRQMEKIATAQGITLVNAGYVFDLDLLLRLQEQDPKVDLQRVEANVLAQEFEELDGDDRDAADELLKAAAEALQPLSCVVEVRKFNPADLPALYCADADVRFLRSLERSEETANPLFQGILGGLKSSRGGAPKPHLILNYANGIVQRLASVKSKPLLMRAVEVLYVQGLMLAHQPLSARELGLLSRGLTGLIDHSISARPEDL
ncbi:MAG: HSP90 family protein [Planctomycetia bacterium]